MKSLEGKVAIVTGGSSGLGKSNTQKFADRGAIGQLGCQRNER